MQLIASVLLALAVGGSGMTATESSEWSLTLRREKQENGIFRVVEEKTVWEPRKTAFILCDMWDKHWCEGATARVGELAPAMNAVVKAARKKGVFIIHAPSDTMEFYKETPQRRRAVEAPKLPTPALKDLPPEPPLPIDDSDGGCDSGQKPWYAAWKRQHPALDIAPEDAISDKGEEVYHLLQARGVENVVLLGVHTNMCVLARPFSIRQMLRLGKNVVLMRDMTDTMYNPQSRPYVSHFKGTELVVQHIERYLCPTITSSAVTGKAPFRFKADKADTER